MNNKELSETLNALWPDFLKYNVNQINAHIRRRFNTRAKEHKLKAMHLSHDETIYLFSRGEIIGYARIDWGEPCLNFVAK